MNRLIAANKTPIHSKIFDWGRKFLCDTNRVNPIRVNKLDNVGNDLTMNKHY